MKTDKDTLPEEIDEVPQTPEEISNKCVEHMTKLNEENFNEL